MRTWFETRRRWGRPGRLGIVALVLTISTVAGAAPVSATVRLEDGGNVPFYARITTIGEPDQIFHDDEWAAIVFYRSPSCVPRGEPDYDYDFDLLTFFDFGAFACEPTTTKGFNLWRNGPGIDPAPFLAISRDDGPVPVWFVPWPVLEAEVQDGVLRMSELWELPRLEGAADSFHQVLQPHDAAAVPMTQFVARGTLEDGRSFRVHGLFIEGTTIQTHIAIDAA